jgi:hypothetical protein
MYAHSSWNVHFHNLFPKDHNIKYILHIITCIVVNKFWLDILSKIHVYHFTVMHILWVTISNSQAIVSYIVLHHTSIVCFAPQYYIRERKYNIIIRMLWTDDLIWQYWIWNVNYILEYVLLVTTTKIAFVHNFCFLLKL